MTVELSKGDLLGVILVFVPALVGVMLLIAVFMFVLGVGERPRGWEWIPPVVMVGTVCLTCWGLWEIAHWFAA